MFKIGDLVIYSWHGICKIDDICEKTISGITSTYYVLHPLESNHKLTISTPIDNDKVIMLELVQKEEAREILESFKYPGIEWNENANMRPRIFTDIVSAGDRKKIAKLVNTLMRKKIEAELREKKLYERDDKLLTSTQKTLFNELAISLNTTFDEIYERVIGFIKENSISPSEQSLNLR
ncbi:CarD family transcriptional regulator [bacterium LRH843]|nr:CarD family transcriptional regulator [bacterium LRH843]